MPHGRKYRVNHFKNRAMHFWKAFQKGKLVETRESDMRRIEIGTGSARGLINKRRPLDYQPTKSFVERLNDFIQKNDIKLKHIQLVPVHGMIIQGKNYSDDRWIQEYFPRPTLKMADRYFSTTHRGWLSKNEQMICKRFFSQKFNRTITKETIQQCYHELTQVVEQLQSETISKTNVTLLGTNRDGTVRLGIIDT